MYLVSLQALQCCGWVGFGVGMQKRGCHGTQDTRGAHLCRHRSKCVHTRPPGRGRPRVGRGPLQELDVGAAAPCPGARLPRHPHRVPLPVSELRQPGCLVATVTLVGSLSELAAAHT